MPVLDAKALKTDRKGLAFLRSVLRPEQGSDGRDGRKPADAPAAKPQSPTNNTGNR